MQKLNFMIDKFGLADNYGINATVIYSKTHTLFKHTQKTCIYNLQLCK